VLVQRLWSHERKGEDNEGKKQPDIELPAWRCWIYPVALIRGRLVFRRLELKMNIHPVVEPKTVKPGFQASFGLARSDRRRWI
jgi:hypothetical protein